MAFYSPHLVRSPLSAHSDSPQSQTESTCGNLPEVRSRDLERRIRREIANSNERRRMQSINSGFRALKMLLPQADGEKMSKAAILQHAAEHIYALQQEKARTAHQTAHLTWLLASMQESTAALQQQQQQRQLSDQRVSPPTDHPTASLAVSLAETHQELAHLRIELERERRVRANVEKRLSSLTSSFQSAPPDSNSSPAEKDTPMGDDSDTPRGTLDTIVRAIRHLEGDRVFTPVPDEESS